MSNFGKEKLDIRDIYSYKLATQTLLTCIPENPSLQGLLTT